MRVTGRSNTLPGTNGNGNNDNGDHVNGDNHRPGPKVQPQDAPMHVNLGQWCWTQWNKGDELTAVVCNLDLRRAGESVSLFAWVEKEWDTSLGVYTTTTSNNTAAPPPK
jgi:hypothetical protein